VRSTVLPVLLLFGALISGALFIAPVRASSAEMLSLQDWLKKPNEQQEPSYPFVRCAGLYFALFTYVGSERLGQDASRNYQATIVSLSLVAMKARSIKRGGNVAAYEDEVERDRLAIAEIYSARMHQNYVTSGQAFSEDSVLRQDFAICKELASGKSYHRVSLISSNSRAHLLQER
jgi:hypothetical protein